MLNEQISQRTIRCIVIYCVVNVKYIMLDVSMLESRTHIGPTEPTSEFRLFIILSDLMYAQAIKRDGIPCLGQNRI